MLGEIFRLLLLVLAMIAGAIQTMPEPAPSPTPGPARSVAPWVEATPGPVDPCDELEDMAEDDPDAAEEWADEHDCDWE